MKSNIILIAGAISTALGIGGIAIKDNEKIAEYKKPILFISAILALVGCVVTLASLDNILSPEDEEELLEDCE